jgi:hypothetical protein
MGLSETVPCYSTQLSCNSYFSADDLPVPNLLQAAQYQSLRQDNLRVSLQVACGCQPNGDTPSCHDEETVACMFC